MDESNVEPKDRISNDILLEVYDYIRIEDLFRWLTVSTQFTECIHRSLKIRKFITFGKNDGFGCIPVYDCYLRYFSQINSSRDPIDTHNSNIEKALHFDSTVITNITCNYYYISKSLDTLNNIFTKCSQIRCLGLNHCYLDEQSFEILDQNLNKLEILLLSKCFLAIDRLEDLPQKMRSLSNRITNLTLLDNCENTGQELIKFVQMFKCLTNLHIDLEKWSATIQLLRQLPLSLKMVSIYALEEIDITEHEFSVKENSQLKSIFMANLIISSETLNNIISDTNLKEIGFNCIEINEHLLTKIANRWTELRYLRISTCNFTGEFNTMQSIQFKTVRILSLWWIGLNPNQLKAFINAFENIKTFGLNIKPENVNCIADESKLICSACYHICYEIFSRLESLKSLIILFEDITLSIIRSLKDLPKLKVLKICGLNESYDQDVIDSYEEHLPHLLIYLVNTCIENPKKYFRLKLEEKSTKLPNSLKIPKNLLIIKGKIY